MEQILALVLIVVVAAVSMAMKNYFNIKRPKKILPEETKIAEMNELSSIIRSGAKTFMITEYKIIVLVVVSLAISLSLSSSRYRLA